MFDKTPDDSTLDFYLGDVRYIEGLWRGVSEMRVGEKAKIKMK
jgi:FKBP-type peptidyl-prolyl cis-trans isomerase